MCSIEYMVVAVMAVLIVMLFVLGFSGRSEKRSRSKKALRDRGKTAARTQSDKPARMQSPAGGFHTCPLCGTILEKREKVKSVLYPGKPDGIMEIHGCPYCFGPGARSLRICPVCSKIVPEGAVIYARFFETPHRRHVHVLGCPSCYTRHTRP